MRISIYSYSYSNKYISQEIVLLIETEEERNINEYEKIIQINNVYSNYRDGYFFKRSRNINITYTHITYLLIIYYRR